MSRKKPDLNGTSGNKRLFSVTLNKTVMRLIRQESDLF